MRSVLAGLITLALLASSHGSARGQVRAPEDGGLTRSLGQPQIWQWHAGAGAGWIFTQDAGRLVAEGRGGVYTDLTNPTVGLLGLQAEAYAGARGVEADYGLRAQVVSPYFRVGVGVDLNGLDREAYLLLSAFHPIRRGGILGAGSMIRLNYLVGRDHSFNVGIQVPVGRRIHMGRTRPPTSDVVIEMPKLPPHRYAGGDTLLERTLGDMAATADWIQRLVAPFMEQDAWSRGAARDALTAEMLATKAYLKERGPGHPDGRTLETEVRRFHADMDRAFSLATEGPKPLVTGATSTGCAVAAYARELLLEEVILPYDRLLGQSKDEDTVLGFGTRARGIFLKWLHTREPIPKDRVEATLEVFTEIILMVDDVRRRVHRDWDQSRYVWLPLQYALLPEEHDSQTELDRLVERAVGQEFTEGNRVWYVVNEQFPIQLGRMIHEARDYHVLWIHDVRGMDAFGNPDEVSYRLILGSYLAAMTDRVREYDRTGRFPTFMIFLDQWYYELRQSRLWMSLLEDPLGHHVDLPPRFRSWADSLAEAQEQLRDAVAHSRLLQDQAGQWGEDWLRNLIKVHVSITNPGDPSFWRSEMIPIWGITDDIMRDHRKIAFYDVTEEDPYRGGAIYTGAGVGEHYTTLNWEDRAILAEGPALLTLKYAARDLLIHEGIPEDEVPWVLQARPKAPDYDQRIRDHLAHGRINARAMEIHNQTGYLPKPLNVAKATLYSLMPSGSVILAPDPLWNSGFWGGLLVGHALRGGRSLIIAPAPANAPSTLFFEMPRVQEVFERFVLIESLLREELDRTGGLLKVGIYAPDFEVTDLQAKVAAFQKTLDSVPWFRDLYDFPDNVDEGLERAYRSMEGQNQAWRRQLHFEDEGVPRLHLKANFLASAEAWSGLMKLPDWPSVVGLFLQMRARQIENRDLALTDLQQAGTTLIDVGQSMIDRWMESLTPLERERLVSYLLVGSHNQNYRSLVMDGEAAFLVSGWTIIAGVIDLVALSGQVHWVDDTDALSGYFPVYSEWKRRLARWFKVAL